MTQTEAEKKSRIKQLSDLIKKYQQSYYNGESEIPDAEFDKLWDELKSLDSENPLLKKVGADSGNFPKKKHVMPMGSQEKAADPEEFLSWAQSCAFAEYLVEYKLDGASLELQYEQGSLCAAVTRGDGETGDEITENAKKMQGVKTVLSDAEGNKINFTGGIRGEVIMTHKIHETLYSDKANCRNAANGIMKRKDGSGCENLTLIVYDAFPFQDASGLSSEPQSSFAALSDENTFFNDEEEKVLWLKTAGFNTVPLAIFKSAQEVIDYRAKVSQARSQLEYDIDGLVIKGRQIDVADSFRARPEKQIAFKFSLEEAVTVIKNVEWSESGATYTPVAVFDPVNLAGTTVKRASLANPENVRKLGVKIGSKVIVVKRGEIIPKIEAVLTDFQDDASSPSAKETETKEIEFPKVCLSCGTPLLDEGTRLFCPNKNCPKRMLHQIRKWIACADIRDAGDTLIGELFKTNKVRSISALYKLTVKDLEPYFLNEESLAEKKKSAGAQKVYDSIQNHRVLDLCSFVAGFDIEGIGETTVKKLVEAGFDTIQKLFSAEKEQIAAVYGFADITAQTFLNGMNENKEEMLYLLDSKTITIKENKTASLPLSRLSFCFTGELASMKRAQAENLVKQNGGTCKSSVTKDLTYLVTNDVSSGSSKNQKAAKLGIKIINEQQFLDLLKAPVQS